MPGEASPIIIRMIQADRQAINRMIKHKRAEFECVIKKGIVSMLNAQDERSQLSEHHDQYLGFLTANSQTKKKQIAATANSLKDSTSSAPMGLGSAVSLAATGVSALGSAILDNAEIKRQQTDAEERLFSAQILHYVSSKDYEAIAQQVASILSYRFQFLLFRLAAGENGYIKLANFFVASMKTYAIARLREYKGEEIKALIDAAIPPSTDALSYREWPQVDLSNFKMSLMLGVRKKLDLDEDANQILERCGPAVRALLGGYQQKVDSFTGQVVNYKPYTILGALNHAPILNHEAGIISGLETKHRKQEALDGSMKYPMILLGNGETTADLGVNFATKSMGKFLDEAHVLALRRLVPDFFVYDVNYEINPKSSAVHSISLNASDFVYRTESYECPWTGKREIIRQQRILGLYQASLGVIEDEEVVATEHHGKLKAMEIASNLFDVNEARKDGIQAKAESEQAQIEFHSADLKTEDHLYKRLKAVKSAKYAALAVSEIMAGVVKSNTPTEDYFKLSIDIIETAKAALNVAHDLPIKEANMRKQLTIFSKQAFESATVAFELQAFCQDSLQIVVELMNTTRMSALSTIFNQNEEITRSTAQRLLRNQIKTSLSQSSKLTEQARAIANYEQDTTIELQPTAVLDGLYAAASSVRDEIDNPGTRNDVQALLQIIELCVIYTQKNYNDICFSLETDDYLINTNNDWLENKRLNELMPSQSKAIVLAAATGALEQVKSMLTLAQSLVTELNVWQLYISLSPQAKQSIITAKDNAVRAKNLSISILRSIEVSPKSELNIDNAYLERVAANNELSRLSLISCKKESTDSIAGLSSPLRIPLAALQTQIRDLEHAVKINHLQLATQANARLIETTNQFHEAMSLKDIISQARRIRRALDTVEMAVADDFEILNLFISKTQQAIDQAKQALQAISAAEGKLVYLKKICLEDTDSDESVSTHNSNFDSSVLRTSAHMNVPSIIDKQLDNLIKGFSQQSADLDSADIETTPDEEMVIRALNQIIDSCSERTNQNVINAEWIKATILTKLNCLKKEISLNSVICPATNWGIWIVAVTVKFIVQTVHTMEHGAGDQTSIAIAAGESVRQIAGQVSPDLKAATDIAFLSIKQACQDIYNAQQVLSKKLRHPTNKTIQTWSLVSSTLAWAGRLNATELKWSQEQSERRSLQRQEELRAIQAQGAATRSPLRIAYTFMLAYSNAKLSDKKKLSGELNKLQAPCSKQRKNLQV